MVQKQDLSVRVYYYRGHRYGKFLLPIPDQIDAKRRRDILPNLSHQLLNHGYNYSIPERNRAFTADNPLRILLIFTSMDRLRKFIVLALPVIVMIAWAGCIAVCAEDTSEHELPLLSAHQPEDCGAAITPLCIKACTLETPAVSAERQSITVAGAEDAPAAIRKYFVKKAAAQPRAPVVKRKFLSYVAEPLTARPGNLRV